MKATPGRIGIAVRDLDAAPAFSRRPRSRLEAG